MTMDQSADHIREVSNTLYKYHLDNFLCDVFITTPEGVEVPVHSIVMSAMSSKLRSAFKETDNEQFVGKDFIYRIHMSESDVSIIEIVLQFMYTGNIILPHGVQLDITRVLACGQKLGLDANRLAGCLGAMLGLMDSSVVENMPPVVLTDEEVSLEIVVKEDN